MKTLLIFPFFFLSSELFAQSAAYQESKIFENEIVNNSTIEGFGAFALSTGATIQIKIECSGCTVATKIYSSVDGISYAEITELTKVLPGPTTAVFNLYGQFFKYFKIEVSESASAPATINASYSTKSQL